MFARDFDDRLIIVDELSIFDYIQRIVQTIIKNCKM